MKKNILALFAFFLIICSACAQAKKTVAKSNIMMVEIHRSPCFGKCPDYMLRISSNGTATYVGRKFAPYEGTYTKNIGTAKVQRLFREFQGYRIDTCREKYQSIPDLPGLDITVAYKSHTKMIRNANSPLAPIFLRELGAEVDSTAVIDNSWKKIADKTKE